jgi:hypothetical protein
VNSKVYHIYRCMLARWVVRGGNRVRVVRVRVKGGQG